MDVLNGLIIALASVLAAHQPQLPPPPTPVLESMPQEIIDNIFQYLLSLQKTSDNEIDVNFHNLLLVSRRIRKHAYEFVSRDIAHTPGVTTLDISDRTHAALPPTNRGH
ncbi:hypothetical protein TWF703_000029 [Orbilia oligospora]|uniref:F-box domain-containing protein n=1 Tax=Orbilia oligospora TaxID=2813651 RepID=A0A7C8JU16_ORBOL|nr:hypothetical protein TWF703_000029 [Orbilia oligospora]